MHKFVYVSVTQCTCTSWLYKTQKIPTNDLHCTLRTENHILFHCICISGFCITFFYFSVRNLVSQFVKEIKTTRRRRQCKQIHVSIRLGGAIVCVFCFYRSVVRLSLSCRNVQESKWFAIFVVSREIFIPLNGERERENMSRWRNKGRLSCKGHKQIPVKIESIAK